VATVALHVSSLIKRGHLRKRDRSARSLELVKPTDEEPVKTNFVTAGEEKWLVDKVEHMFKDIETAPFVVQAALDQLYVLVGALKVLGLDGAAQSFVPRITGIKAKVKPEQTSV
jgi:hypothetical protein